MNPPSASPNTMLPRPVAQLGVGQVRHTRLRPQRHAFAYDTFFLLLPMRHVYDATAMGGLSINTTACISFHDADHGDGRGPEHGGALAWLQDLLHQHGLHDADGEIWLHTYPRVLGYAFKPVSFWYCHRPDGSLRAVLAEVNNTFGERHCYLLEPAQYGAELRASKCFHVSPFCSTTGHYRFRFMRSSHPGADRMVARVDYDDDHGPLLQTSVSGRLHPITPALLRYTWWRYPAMSALIMARIHWQALRLWLKRMRLHRKPTAPEQFVTR